MTETVKIELSNEEDTLEEIALAFGAPFTADKFRKEVGHILENSKKYHGIFTLPDTSSTTDKLSVEKLQEQLNTAKKYIEHVIGTIKHDGHLGTIQTDWILPDLEKALATIGEV